MEESEAGADAAGDAPVCPHALGPHLVPFALPLPCDEESRREAIDCMLRHAIEKLSLDSLRAVQEDPTAGPIESLTLQLPSGGLWRG